MPLDLLGWVFGTRKAEPGDEYRTPPAEPDAEKTHPDQSDEYEDRKKEWSHPMSLPAPAVLTAGRLG
jgi:hypothetical protein